MNSTTVLMAVYNAERWLDGVLRSIETQTQRPEQVIVWDNASTDGTDAILRRYPWITRMRCDENIGLWAAIERMLPHASGAFVACLTDVVLCPEYLQQTTAALVQDESLGAVQGVLIDPTSAAVDGYGFSVNHSRAVTICGHGAALSSTGPPDIFGVEGAAPVFRKAAIDDIRVDGWFVDPMYRVGSLGYGDDFDIAWRLRLRGWGQRCIATAVGYHDRSTTHGTARSLLDRVRRRRVRSAIHPLKRQLDWANVRFTIIKNDAMMDILRDAWRILGREVLVQGYMLLFEPRVLMAWGRFLRLLPRMVAVRRKIRSRSKIADGSVRHALT